MPIYKVSSNQKGAIHLLFILAILGITSFFVVSNFFSFKDKIFQALYDKKFSLAAVDLNCQKIQPELVGQKRDLSRVKETEEQLKQVNKELFSNSKLLQNANEQDKSQIKEKIKGLVSKRKGNLSELIRKDPSIALAYIIPNNFQSVIPLITDECFEKEVVEEGTVEVLHSDNFKDLQSVNYYILHSNTGVEYMFYPARGFAQLTPGIKVKVKGYKLDTDIIFDALDKSSITISSVQDNSNSLVKRVSAQGVKDSLGDQKTIVIMANFRNTPLPSLTKATVDDVVFNKTNYFHKENSYTKTTISGNSVGWYTMQIDQTCSVGAVQTEAIKVADPYVDFTQYTRIIITAPYGGLSCGWTGMSTVGKTNVNTADGKIYASVAWIDSSDFKTDLLSHEFGHSLGSSHASFWRCNDLNPIWTTDCFYGRIYDEYNKFDIMGYGTGHMNVVHKAHLGFIDNVREITASGNYLINPLETNSNLNLKGLKIKRWVDYYGNLDYLFLEYRQPIGIDLSLSKYCCTDILKGATAYSLVYPQPAFYQAGLLDTTLPIDDYISILPNKTFVDPASGIKIKTILANSSSLTISVQLGKTDFDLPIVTITSPLNNANVSGQVPISVNASDSSGIQKVEFFWGNGKLIGTDDTAPYSIQWDTTKLPSDYGTYYIYAMAYDKSGEAYGALPNVAISNAHYLLVDNHTVDKVTPTVKVTYPTDNSIVSQNINNSIVAVASDNIGVSKIEFLVDDKLIGTTQGSSVIKFDTTALATNTAHKITAKAYDATGNTNLSSVTITLGSVSISVSRPVNSCYGIQLILSLGWTPVNGASFYKVFRDNGVKTLFAATTDKTGFIDQPPWPKDDNGSDVPLDGELYVYTYKIEAYTDGIEGQKLIGSRISDNNPFIGSSCLYGV